MTRFAYIDCFAGASGDMFLGALLDAGWSLDELQAVVIALGIPGVTVSAQRVTKHHLAGTHITVHAPEAQPLRHPSDLIQIIQDAAGLPDAVKQRATGVIMTLADAEAQVHGVPVEEIHFHEVGAVDTLVDVVGVIAGLDALHIDQVVSSPVPWSHGTVRIAHGKYPVPPPAVAVLLTGLPVVGVDVQGETVTPTGAVLLRELSSAFGVMPAMTVTSLGYGAGTRDWPDRPNMLRLVLGEAPDTTGQPAITTETLTVLACNLDDMVPEWYGTLIDGVLAAGALDVWLTPVHMKKGRPAITVEVLCRPADAHRLRDMLFHETTTLGVRSYAVTRWALSRDMQEVDTPFGAIRVKIAHLPGGKRKISPEYEDCVQCAHDHGVSVREVWMAAVQSGTM